MSDPTPAQEEFNKYLANASGSRNFRGHPADQDDSDADERSKHRRDADSDSDNDLDEEDRYRAAQIDRAMKMPATTTTTTNNLKLPPAEFDLGCATGVKGVIADARSYERARKTQWKDRVRGARRSVLDIMNINNSNNSSGSGSTNSPNCRRARRRNSNNGASSTDESAGEDDEERFLRQWRESRRRELEVGARTGQPPRRRRTSPSVRVYGRLDEVDALGYLDAIEKVSRDTTVVVFVYDHECPVSESVEDSLLPLVAAYRSVHFVKVHYEDIEFDNAAVPAILAYRNQGDLSANLTGLIEMMPDDGLDDWLLRLLEEHGILP